MTNLKSVIDEHVTRSPLAVRLVLCTERRGRAIETAKAFEMTECAPKHIESTAQVTAKRAGGGQVVFGGHTKPMKRGGANKAGSTSRVAHTVGCNELRASASTSEVSELDDASRKNAAMLAAECVTVSLSLSLSLSDTSAGMASVATKTGDDAEGGGHALGVIGAAGDGVT